MARRALENAVVIREEFYIALGHFHTMCSVLDPAIDYAICKFLAVPAKDAHLITPGMMFGRKTKLLADLIGHNKRLEKEKRARLLGAVNALRTVRRDAITHSYIWSSKNEVNFLERKTTADFRAIEHKFTLESFATFVDDFAAKAMSFHKELGAAPRQLSLFANAALSLDRKSSKSPGRQ
jgi:hypothetical protein